MKRALLFLTLLFAACFCATAQTNFPKWEELRSERYGFTIQYPEFWEVNEQPGGEYIFTNEDPNQALGTYFINVEEDLDSARALGRQVILKEENNGSVVTQLGNRSMLIYKTVTLKNGVDIEIHHWVVAEGSRLYHCSYAFPTQLRNAPQLVDEMTMAYKMIEMLNFNNQ